MRFLLLSKRIQQFATGKRVAISFGFYIVFQVLMLGVVSPVFTYYTDLTLLDLRLWYAPQEVYAFMEALSVHGRRIYQVFFVADGGFLVSYSAFYMLLLAYLLKKAFTKPLLSILCFLPMAIGVMDLLENISLFTIIHYFPYQMESLARLAGVLSTTKYLMTAAAIMLMVLSAVVILKRNLSPVKTA